MTKEDREDEESTGAGDRPERCGENVCAMARCLTEQGFLNEVYP